MHLTGYNPSFVMATGSWYPTQETPAQILARENKDLVKKAADLKAEVESLRRIVGE